jgi:hypothetical protein
MAMLQNQNFELVDLEKASFSRKRMFAARPAGENLAGERPAIANGRDLVAPG